MNTLLQLFEDPSLARVFSNSERSEITKYCLRFMFKLDTLPVFKDNLDEYGLRTETWRNNMGTSSAAARIKFWVRYIAVHPTKIVAKKFGVKKWDADIKHLLLSDEQLRKDIAGIPGQVFTWKKMQHILANIMLDLAKFVKIRVYTKLRFLKNDSGNDLEDFESELLADVISGLYKKYPKFDSYAHMLNTGRTIINNMSVNIIKHHTSQGRQTKYQNEDGSFSSHKVSLDALTENKASSESFGAEGISTVSEELMEMETEQSLASLLNSPKKKLAFKLLLDYDKKFSQWLVATKRTTVVDNNKFQDRLIVKGRPDEYINHVADYLEIPQQKLQRFFINLLSGLGIDSRNLRNFGAYSY